MRWLGPRIMQEAEEQVKRVAPRSPSSSHEAVSFGEIVFDRFRDAAHLGGAPLNFACYLRQFGVSVALVSAVGGDERGETAIRALTAADVDTTWVASRPQPTGTADVSLVDGDPEFEVAEGSAWEHIAPPGDLTWARPGLLYFGTVAQKTDINRATLASLRSSRPRHVLLDINLRPGLHSPETVLRSLYMASILKMNEMEWQVVRSVTSQDAPAGLLESYGLELIALTRGSKGAELHTPSGTHAIGGRKLARLVDQVGAGDAFSAALAAGVIRGADPDHTLQVAADVGAAAVQSRGAVVDLPDSLKRAFGSVGSDD